MHFAGERQENYFNLVVGARGSSFESETLSLQMCPVP